MVTAPYGSWPSPVSVEMLTGGTVGLSAPAFDGVDLYWLEAHADQGGRVSLWRRRGGATVEVTAEPFNVRTRVHEYGGGEYAASAEIVVFSHFADDRVYRVGPVTTPEPMTPEGPFRYADLRIHPERGLVLAVREDHRSAGEPVNTLVALDLDGDNRDGGRILCSGADFYASPELSADGRLAWVEWNHPNMPWDATSLRVGTLTGAGLADVVYVAGGAAESVLHPRWLPDGGLVFVSDRTGWWNLYRWADGDAAGLLERSAEFTVPPWRLGGNPYAVLDDHRLAVTWTENGYSGLGVLDLDSHELEPLGDHREAGVEVVAANGVLASVLASESRPARLAVLDLSEEQRSWRTVRAASEVDLPSGLVSVAEPVTWRGDQGEVHGWYYPPTNPDFAAPPDSLPPMITRSHGGPTAMARNSFSLEYQYWTSRGIAILDVNYSGSTGYGRGYRERLRGTWGVADVADCVAGALAMADRRLADPDRLVIEGGSAGGYTTLQALTSSDVFAAGISLYGVGDLAALATDTHKFESRYLDGLVGPYPAEAERYRERSPIFRVDQLSCPLLILQGADDVVVPPSQAKTMADAVRQQGLPVAMIIFAGEGHGFRAAATIRAAIQAELYFLGRVLGFEPADELPAIAVDNLPGQSGQ